MIKCAPCVQYHPREDAEAIATVTSSGRGSHRTEALGPLCLLNKLTYWHLFVAVTALPGHEARTAEIEAEAQAIRTAPRGGVAEVAARKGRAA